jgi:hypothetical protein
MCMLDMGGEWSCQEELLGHWESMIRLNSGPIYLLGLQSQENY